MPVKIRDKTYYRTKETLQLIGIGRSTLFRWIDRGNLNDASHLDKRGWRLFTVADIERIKEEVNQLT